MDPKPLIDALEVSEEKRKWIEQYAQYHLEAEKNPIVEQPAPERAELSHFEIHPTMKEMWKGRKTI
jgi:hypothetical protein